MGRLCASVYIVCLFTYVNTEATEQTSIQLNTKWCSETWNPVRMWRTKLKVTRNKDITWQLRESLRSYLNKLCNVRTK